MKICRRILRQTYFSVEEVSWRGGVSVRIKWLAWFWSVHVEVGFYMGTGRGGRAIRENKLVNLGFGVLGSVNVGVGFYKGTGRAGLSHL
jgi:hypothetical protein